MGRQDLVFLRPARWWAEAMSPRCPSALERATDPRPLISTSPLKLGGIEAQTRRGTCPRPLQTPGAEPGLGARSSGPQASLLSFSSTQRLLTPRRSDRVD